MDAFFKKKKKKGKKKKFKALSLNNTIPDSKKKTDAQAAPVVPKSTDSNLPAGLQSLSIGGNAPNTTDEGEAIKKSPEEGMISEEMRSKVKTSGKRSVDDDGWTDQPVEAYTPLFSSSFLKSKITTLEGSASGAGETSQALEKMSKDELKKAKEMGLVSADVVQQIDGYELSMQETIDAEDAQAAIFQAQLKAKRKLKKKLKAIAEGKNPEEEKKEEKKVGAYRPSFMRRAKAKENVLDIKKAIGDTSHFPSLGFSDQTETSNEAKSSSKGKASVWGANRTDDLDDIEDEPEVEQITPESIELKTAWTPDGSEEEGTLRPESEVTYDFLSKRCKSFLNEYLANPDFVEAKLSLKELKCPYKHDEVVGFILERAIDFCKDDQIEALGNLIIEFCVCKEGIEKEKNIHYITPSQLEKGLSDFESFIPDLKIDFPSVTKVYPKLKEQLISAGIVKTLSPLLYRNEKQEEKNEEDGLDLPTLQFIKSSFNGFKRGYVFTSRDEGLGYYRCLISDEEDILKNIAFLCGSPSGVSKPKESKEAVKKNDSKPNPFGDAKPRSNPFGNAKPMSFDPMKGERPSRPNPFGDAKPKEENIKNKVDPFGGAKPKELNRKVDPFGGAKPVETSTPVEKKTKVDPFGGAKPVETGLKGEKKGGDGDDITDEEKKKKLEEDMARIKKMGLKKKKKKKKKKVEA